jgi:hypothetical protein
MMSEILWKESKINVSIIIQIDPAHIKSGEQQSTPKSDEEDFELRGRRSLLISGLGVRAIHSPSSDAKIMFSSHSTVD